MARDKIADQMTRSVPLAGGMQDDVPEFLQDFPSLAYVENGRFRKTNEVEKTIGQIDMELAPPSGQPVAIETAGDTLLVLGDESVREYREGIGWRGIAGSGNPIATKSDVCSSAQEGGAMHFGWAKSTIGDELYVVAYETRTSAVDTPDEFSVCIELFYPDGSFISKECIPNARAPQVNQTNDGRVLVHYAEPDQILFPLLTNYFLWVYDTHLQTSTRLTDGGNIEVLVSCPMVDAIFAAGSTVEQVIEFPEPFAPTSIPLDSTYDLLRMGFNPVGVNAWYHVFYAGEGGTGGVLYYADANASNNLKLVRLDEAGQPAFNKLTTINNNPSTSPQQYFPLAVHYNVADDQTWTLYGYRNASNNTTTLGIQRYDGLYVSGTPNDSHLIIEEENLTLCNASVHSENPGSAMVAWTQVTLDESRREFRQTTTINPVRASVQCRSYISGGLVVTIGSIDDHRLTSNILTEGFTQVFATEQFVLAEPYQKGYQNIPQGNIDVYNPPLAGIKPTTGILVSVNNMSVKPIATFDANTSKHTNFFMQEQNPLLGRLRKEGNSYFYCNRQLLQKEDFFKFVRKPKPNIRLGNVCWYTGEYRGNLFEVNTKPDKIQTTKYGNSVILNTALPLWYAGGDISEMSVLEQPEVRYVDTEDGDAFAFGYIEPLSDEPDRWASYQVIIGFVDANGQAHRSAPSFPLYVWGLNKQDVDIDTDTRQLGFTRPITSFDSPESYFIEVYTAKSGDTPVLAHRQPLPDGRDIIFADQSSIDSVDFDPVRLTEGVYTTNGAEVAADPWPSFDQAVVTSRRMFAIEGSTLYFSKLLQENVSPEFNAVFTIPFGRGRKLRAVGKIDDKVMVFEDDAIHAIYGDGPDNTGSGNPFIVDNLQTTVGCSDPESVIEIPEGLLFYSANSKEFHLIDRDLNIQDVGKAVQDLTEDIDILAAVQFPREHEVRWYVTGGPAEEFGPDPEPPTRPPRPRYTNVLPVDPVLVYNYHYKKWSVLSGQPAISVTLFKDEVVTLGDDWSVKKTGEYWANSEPMKYRLPWLRVQDLQNFGRIREIVLLGKYLSAWRDNGDGHEAGDIKITSKYDYEVDGLTHTHLWQANKDMKPGDGERLQFGFKPGKPKCQAIQLTIEEVPTMRVDDSEPVYTNGRGFVLSGLDLLYSLKRGFGLKSLGQSRSK